LLFGFKSLIPTPIAFLRLSTVSVQSNNPEASDAKNTTINFKEDLAAKTIDGTTGYISGKDGVNYYFSGSIEVTDGAKYFGTLSSDFIKSKFDANSPVVFNISVDGNYYNTTNQAAYNA